ncbi:uncharacterized protein MELLADRAFT_116324 [Melampsora larici-populina 98AG31]|uniref:Phosphoacetylglucosamine mutase n=1 Tax=Melampsora larici-populina (strain 98AG31 / pathotype 3-4-7) TaxID=747676 RepID=F4RK03_MELLP|nr:uncharacterized protein MELLADRAFT_116324 [Melampsora larici-populina 98AG31]EGG07404.1 hypothetical protein MELLADRAFT_116324 [Melampsora larici-populina 98AG31]
MDSTIIKEAQKNHPLTPNYKYAYGTAGFRDNAKVLDSVFFSVGLLAVLRSKKLDGQTIGVMITASHNPEEDNGVKLIDPQGEMLNSSWESHATSLANSSNHFKTLEEIIKVESIDLKKPAKIIYGHDTRPSCASLIKAFRDGIDCLSKTGEFEVIEGGLKTTPQLHYLVKCWNDGGVYGHPSEEGYYQKLSNAFNEINARKSTLPTLTVDCANGVGAPKLEALQPYLSTSPLSFQLINTEIHTLGKLNKSCGADYVKTTQSAPPVMKLEPFQRVCSFDGDADRIVYYYSNGDRFRLMDGDKIASLVAGYVKDLIGLEDQEIQSKARIGVVQTAYANGNSTRYITETLGFPVTCTPTGVKYLHHAAQEYDIGIYFEANGHGTVIFKPDFLKTLPSTSNLSKLANLINQTVGDSISDMLLVETILLQKEWGMKEWDEGYEELPNRLVKVLVTDRNAFKTIDAERKLLEPNEMQIKLDQIVEKFRLGRSFIRPSGTEDCVRVYAEAETREMTDELAFKVAGMVFDYSGKGEKPKEFL